MTVRIRLDVRGGVSGSHPFLCLMAHRILDRMNGGECMLGILLMSLVNVLIIRKYNSCIDQDSNLEKRVLSNKSLLIGLLADTFCIATLIRDFSWRAPRWTSIPPKDFFDFIDFATLIIPSLVAVIISILYMCFMTSVVESGYTLRKMSVIALGVAVVATLIYPVGDRLTILFFYLNCMPMRWWYMFVEACASVLCAVYIVGKSEITAFRVPPKVPDPSGGRLICKMILILWIVIVAKLYISTSFVYLPLIIYGCVKATKDILVSLAAYQKLDPKGASEMEVGVC